VYFIIYRLFEQKRLKCIFKNSKCFECDQNEVFQRNNSFSIVKKCWPLPVLKVCKVFNGESVNDQCTEHLTLTDSFKIKYAPVVSSDVDKNFLRMSRNVCFRTLCSTQ
jgi:hypothetical protein